MSSDRDARRRAARDGLSVQRPDGRRGDRSGSSASSSRARARCAGSGRRRSTSATWRRAAWTASGSRGSAPWDIAAASLIVEEAGGRISDLDGAPFRVRTGRLLASNGRIHERCSPPSRPTAPSVLETGRTDPPPATAQPGTAPNCRPDPLEVSRLAPAMLSLSAERGRGRPRAHSKEHAHVATYGDRRDPGGRPLLAAAPAARAQDQSVAINLGYFALRGQDSRAAGDVLNANRCIDTTFSCEPLLFDMNGLQRRSRSAATGSSASASSSRRAAASGTTSTPCRASTRT